jgi:hypothetical protein
MLKRLQALPENVSLIGHSGVQFVDYGFKTDKASSGGKTFSGGDFLEVQDNRPGSGPNDGPGWELRRLMSLDSDIPVDSTTGQPTKSVYSIRVDEALKAFNNMWLPAPFLKMRGGQGAGGFEQGPSNWARMRISKLDAPDAQGYEFRITFAFDTRILRLPLDAPYAGPRSEDVGGSRFKLASNLPGNSWFLRERWVWLWLKDTLELAKTVNQPKVLNRHDGKLAQCAPWAYYCVLLDAVVAFVNGKNSNARLPIIRFIDPAPANGEYDPIDVHLVMDIGNSRTCGVLIERDKQATGVDLKTTIRLELRDLSQPQYTYDEPFRSHVEFARAEFGLSHHAFEAGIDNAFRWPSLMRVGPEALRLNGASSGAEGDTGLSGPKRYLWDEREHLQQWYFNVAEDLTLDSTPVFGDVLTEVTQDGRLLIDAGSTATPAFISKFSKASLFCFMVMELLLQAISQTNAVGHRAVTKTPNVPRRLSRVVLTIPTGTPLLERDRFQKQCDNAVKLLWSTLEWGEQGVIDHPMPEIDIAYDEATCTQVVWLYSELREKFLSKPSGYLEIMGVPAAGGHSLRVASLDIGGGTTDLMVRTYMVQAQNDALRPIENFREGFRRAGDDIVEAVIAVYVLGSISKHLEQCGIARPADFIKRFMADRDKSATERHKRTLFVTRVLVPIALAILSRFESNGLLESKPESLTPEDVFSDHHSSVVPPIEFFTSAARQAGASHFSFDTVVFDLDFPAISKTVERVIGPILEPLCAAIHELQADVLLVSGRPSRLPTIRSLLLRYAPVPPHRIVFMHDYDVGNWYPFSNSNGVVGDPKTTVVVGALLCTLASTRRIQDFALDENALTIESTADYIGRIYRGQILDEDVIFGRGDPEIQTDSQPVVFTAPMSIGFRQLPLKTWPATPLFFVDFTNPPTLTEERSLPWMVEFSRTAVDGERYPEKAALAVEDLRIASISDRAQSNLQSVRLTLRLQTLKDEGGYWTDTGIVELV